ncbi:MAG: InlB B-repeat-containing protein [Lachnospiraceae bacterium]|nr:InlB B-repeat-containing protein [Lachnospiraceae bacterium]
MSKKLLSLVLCLLMTFSVNTSLFAATVKNSTQEVVQTEEQQEEVDFVGQMPTGLEPLEVIELSPEEYAAAKQAQEEQEEQENVRAANNYDWKKYSGQYCYNHMNASQKRFYKDLEEACYEVATTTDMVTGTDTDNGSVYFLKFVSYQGMSLQEAKRMAAIFIYQNPQYYFVRPRMYYIEAEEELSVGIYSDFADGNKRQTVSTQFMNKINAWETQIADKGSEYERAKEAHDLVCKNVRYVSGTYDQSAYSAVIEGKTVCAGYTKMYGILCNGVGIESVGVTSSDHAWNKVNVDNGWYNVDTTWDDQSSIIYDYFLVSDENVNSGGHHVEEYKVYNVHPESLVDYAIPLTGVSLSECNLTMRRGEQKTLSVVYQPTNTTERPGVVWTSSNPQAVSVDNKGVITAVTPGSSAVITAQVGAFSNTCNVMVEAENYTVTFHANGHGNAPAAQSVPCGGKVTNPGNISATGYTFGGWYKEAACNQAWDFENDVVTGNVTLYAKWTQVPNPSGTPITTPSTTPSITPSGTPSTTPSGNQSGTPSGNTNGNNSGNDSTPGGNQTAEKPQGSKVTSYQGCDFYQDGNGKMRCYDGNGHLVKNNFKCDGIYTYYFQNDGTAMTDRLTYHPDGEHVVYFDENGHEVFSNFAHIKKSIAGDAVDDLCFFDVYGHMYVDFITYDQAGVNLYYANPYGVMEHNGWFRFSDGNIGYANADGTLITDQFSFDQWGRKVYFQGNGKLARGLISDGTTYYRMDETDGYCVEEFPAQ